MGRHFSGARPPVHADARARIGYWGELIRRVRAIRLRRFRRSVGSCVLAVWFATATMTPLASAGPIETPAPKGPLLGQACDDFDKLAYDPAVGQIVCTAVGKWMRSVTPTGVRPLGERCAASERDSVMASSTDGHLIFCPSSGGVWTLYKE
jgi:hypothetical protein